MTHEPAELAELVGSVRTRAHIAALCDRFDYGQIDPIYDRLVERLSALGYTFEPLDGEHSEFGDGAFMFRYDVHVHDIIAGYALAFVHERLKIPGTFYLTWKFTGRERELSHCFKLFKEFDPRFVQLGLHAAPVATWLIEREFGGAAVKARRYLQDDDLAPVAASVAERRRIREGGVNALGELSDDFRRFFGPWTTVTGHGNFVAAVFRRRLVTDRALAGLAGLFDPVRFLQSLDLSAFGLTAERTWLGADRAGRDVMLFDGSFGKNLSPEAVVRRLYDRTPVAITFHPSLLTSLPSQRFLADVLSATAR